MIQRAILAMVLAVLVTGCRFIETTPTSPSPNPTNPAPTPTGVSLTGKVTAAGGWGAPVKGAVVEILDGVNKGFLITTNGDGVYRFDGLKVGNANVKASATEFPVTTAGVYIDGTNTLDFELEPPASWGARGTGSDVFNMPSWIARVRITSELQDATCQSFVVRVGGKPVLSTNLGACSAGVRRYQGVHLVTGGGMVEVVTGNTAVSWSFEWVR